MLVVVNNQDKRRAEVGIMSLSNNAVVVDVEERRPGRGRQILVSQLGPLKGDAVRIEGLGSREPWAG